MNHQPVVLTVAGFDPSGGAGIIADVRAIESFGCAAVAAITSITFQNSQKYLGAVNQTSQSVRLQIESIVMQHEIAAVKIGMLSTAAVVAEVARLIAELNLPAPILDPVMQSSTGGRLLADNAFEVLVNELIPTARVVTPNIPEAEKLAGMNIHNEEQMLQATARVRELGAPAVLIKGGHLRMQSSEFRGQRLEKESRTAVDVLDDGGEVKIFTDEWIKGANVRGTGCLLSSAIAAGIANGNSLATAVAGAKRFVYEAIRDSQPDLELKTQDSKLKTED